MKQVVSSLFFVALTHFGWAQQATPQLKLNPQKIDKLLKGRSIQDFQTNPVPKKDTFKLSHTTAIGNVYTLPQDKMPWLKPNDGSVYKMPIQNYVGDSNIPNAYMSESDKLQLLRKKLFPGK